MSPPVVIDLELLTQEVVGEWFTGDGKVLHCHRKRIYDALQKAYYNGYQYGHDCGQKFENERIREFINQPPKEE